MIPTAVPNSTERLVERASGANAALGFACEHGTNLETLDAQFVQGISHRLSHALARLDDLLTSDGVHNIVA